VIYDITPTPKPRMTQKDKWAKRPVVQKYWAFKKECQLKKVDLPESGSHVIFTIPFPKSYSKKKMRQLEDKPHQSKPDVDNMLKALMDAVYGDDSGVYDVRVSKIWGYTGQIEIKAGVVSLW
jgi:Holliday junction resolvase RusA-like endonuclease